MRALLDCMGGDAGPRAAVEAALAFLRQHPGDRLLLAGSPDVIIAALRQHGIMPPTPHLSVLACSEIIEPDDEPVRAVRRKRDSSMVRGLLALDAGEADYLVSPGNTGALMAGAVMSLGRLPGVERPGLTSVIPTLDHRDLVMLDLGAGVDVRARTLLQYAIMGSAYARAVMGKGRPRVALLNIGTEAGKGDRLRREAYALLRTWDGGEEAEFAGNVETRDLLAGGIDVVVTDGFTGNAVLKAVEGTADAFRELVKRGAGSGVLPRLGGLLLRKSLKAQFERYAYQAHGGATLLGVKRPVIKCHGNSGATAIGSALELGRRAVKGNVTGLIADSLEEVANGE